MDDVCNWDELVLRAGSARRARTLVTSGEWWRVVRGAYASCLRDDGPEVRAEALRVVLPADVALSHRAALWLLGLDVLEGPLDVVVPRGRRLEARPGLRPHTAALPDDDVCEVGGLLATTAARAVADVLRAEPLLDAVAVADAALRAGDTTLPLLSAALARAEGLRGIRRARQTVALVDARSESPMESRLRVGFVLGGLDVRAQVDLYDDRGHVGRGDLLVEGVVCEFDGRDAHLAEDAFVRERRRQSRLLEGGAEVRRFTAADVYRRTPRDLCDEVLRAAAALRARGGMSRLRAGPDTLRPPSRRPLPSRAQQRAQEEEAA